MAYEDAGEALLAGAAEVGAGAPDDGGGVPGVPLGRASVGESAFGVPQIPHCSRFWSHAAESNSE